MPFGGESFEEFVGEYFKYVKNCVVEVYVDYYRKKQWCKNLGYGKARWSDIDVLAVNPKSDEAIVVGCAENGKESSKIIQGLSFAELYVKEDLGFANCQKCFAFATYFSPIPGREPIKDVLKKLKNEKIDVLWFIDMVEEIIHKIRKETNGYHGKTYTFKVGKFTEPTIWLLRELDLVAAIKGRHIMPKPVKLKFDDYAKTEGTVKFP